jgi:RNA-directed DNA polymerase
MDAVVYARHGRWVRELTCRTRGRSIQYVINELMAYINGWWTLPSALSLRVYSITESFNRLTPLAHWVRRRIRAVFWKQWKNRRTRVGELKKRGVTHEAAPRAGCPRKGPWRMSATKWVHFALPDAYLKSLGLRFPWI